MLNIQTKFCSLHPKSCVIAGKSGTHLVCVCAVYQNAVLLVDALDWDVTYTYLVSKILCDSTNRECMMDRCENYPGKEALRTFSNEELTNFDEDEEFHYMNCETTGQTTLQTTTVTCREYIEKVVEDINTLSKTQKVPSQFLENEKRISFTK